jgi:hypothetical protein
VRLAVPVEYEGNNKYNKNKPERKWPLGRPRLKLKDIYVNNKYYRLRAWNGFH